MKEVIANNRWILIIAFYSMYKSIYTDDILVVYLCCGL